MNVLFLTRYGRLGASSRLRALQFFPALAAHGIVCQDQPLFSDALLKAKYASGRYGLGAALAAFGARLRQMRRRDQFDLVWIEKEALPWLPAWLERWCLRGVPYVVDFDDAVFHNYDLHRLGLVRRLLGQRIDRVVAGARLATCGNAYLAARVRAAGCRQVALVPTVIDLARYVVAEARPPADARPSIVWIGSPSTVQYLARLAAPLAQLAQRVDFTLRVIGGELALPGVAVECVPWTEAGEVAAIAACDIGIMPLSDSPWERGKCGYKLIQYMACALPVVASPVGVNVDIVREGVNGFLAADDAAWIARLGQLLDDAALRRSMGREGRHLAETQYSVQVVAQQMATLLRNAEMNTLCAV